jgi:hypothetical protein
MYTYTLICVLCSLESVHIIPRLSRLILFFWSFAPLRCASRSVSPHATMTCASTSLHSLVISFVFQIGSLSHNNFSPHSITTLFLFDTRTTFLHIYRSTTHIKTLSWIRNKKKPHLTTIFEISLCLNYLTVCRSHAR